MIHQSSKHQRWRICPLHPLASALKPQHTLLVAALVATLAPSPTSPSTPAACTRGPLARLAPPPLPPPAAAVAAGFGAAGVAFGAAGLGLGALNSLGADATGDAGLGFGLLLPPKLKPLLLAGAASAASFSRMPLLVLLPLTAALVPSKDSNREAEGCRPARAADRALISCIVGTHSSDESN